MINDHRRHGVQWKFRTKRTIAMKIAMKITKTHGAANTNTIGIENTSKINVSEVT